MAKTISEQTSPEKGGSKGPEEKVVRGEEANNNYTGLPVGGREAFIIYTQKSSKRKKKRTSSKDWYRRGVTENRKRVSGGGEGKADTGRKRSGGRATTHVSDRGAVFYRKKTHQNTEEEEIEGRGQGRRLREKERGVDRDVDRST